jgi:hypothetical protein
MLCLESPHPNLAPDPYRYSLTVGARLRTVTDCACLGTLEQLASHAMNRG